MTRSGFLLFLVSLLLCGAATAAWAAELPGGLRVLPADARRTNVSGSTTIHGVPSRLLGFESRTPPAAVVALYEREWGQPLVRNQVGAAVVLGKAVGKSFITVKLQSIPGGTRGIIAVTEAPTSWKAQTQVQRDLDAWLNRLGSGARLVHHSDSEDTGQRSTLLLFSAQTSEKELARRASQFLVDQGFQLAQDFQTSLDPASHRQGAQALVRLFKASEGAEALLTVFRHTDGYSYVKVNKLSVQ